MRKPSISVIKTIVICSTEHCFDKEIVKRKNYKSAESAARAWADATAWRVYSRRVTITEANSAPSMHPLVNRYKATLYRRALPIFKAMLEGNK